MPLEPPSSSRRNNAAPRTSTNKMMVVKSAVLIATLISTSSPEANAFTLYPSTSARQIISITTKLSTSRVPTGGYLNDPDGNTNVNINGNINANANVNPADHADGKPLPSFLGSSSADSDTNTPNNNNVDLTTANRSRSIRRFSASVKKISSLQEDQSNKSGIGSIVSKFIPKSRAGIVKTVTLAATISSLITCGRTFRAMHNRFEHMDIQEEGQPQPVLVSRHVDTGHFNDEVDAASFTRFDEVGGGSGSAVISTGLPVNTRVRGGTSTSELETTSTAAAATTTTTPVTVPTSATTTTIRSAHPTISSVASVRTSAAINDLANQGNDLAFAYKTKTKSSDVVASSPTLLERYQALSPKSKKNIEVITKSAVIIASVGAGFSISKKPITKKKKLKKKKASINLASFADTLERRIKPASAKKRKAESFHRSLLEAQLRHTAADVTRKRLEEMTNQFARLREEHDALQRASSENKSALKTDLDSATMRLALAETSATGLSRELKRLAGVEMTLRVEVDELKARLVNADKEAREVRVNLGAELKDAQWENRTLQKENKALQKEVESLKVKIEELKKEAEKKPKIITIDLDEPEGKGPDGSGAPSTIERPLVDEADDTGMPSYGRPVLAMDIESDRIVKKALRTVRDLPTVNGSGDVAVIVKPEESQEALNTLSSAGKADAATLTLTGYKGGPIEESVNQDRAVIVSPFLVGDKSADNCLMIMVDGHNADGEIVSEYATDQIPKVLAEKLVTLDQLATDEKWAEDRRVEETKQALIDTFVEVHKRGESELPTKDGGCTASAVLQLDDKVYVANAGDSQSLIATFAEETGDITVVYVSRDDTPELEDERARIEKAGGVIHEMDGSTRVLYFDDDGVPHGGLAISRALGDWDLNKVGIIPEPIVDVIDLKDVISDTTDKVHVFAVSATDGLLDFIERPELMCKVVEGLYVEDSPHIFTALEDMILKAKSGWYEECGDEYRDDITIAASSLTI